MGMLRAVAIRSACAVPPLSSPPSVQQTTKLTGVTSGPCTGSRPMMIRVFR